jgi:death on curing protein
LPSEPRWLAAGHVVEMNKDLVARTGEPYGVRDIGLLESAVARPVHHWHYGEAEIVPLAVALLLGIAKNHPFVQGNKRTALVAADAFLHLNGYELAVPDDALAGPIIDVLSGIMTEEALVRLFDASIRRTAP